MRWELKPETKQKGRWSFLLFPLRIDGWGIWLEWVRVVHEYKGNACFASYYDRSGALLGRCEESCEF